jgi:hypothetical protein
MWPYSAWLRATPCAADGCPLDKSRPRAYSAPVAGFRDRRAFWNGLGAALAALAVVLQVLAPQGFMPGRTANGPSLVICTGHGPLLRASDLGSKAPGGDHHEVCPFAGHAAAPVLAAGPQVLPVRIAYAAQPPAIETRSSGARALAAPPPPATGPPASA